LSSLRKARLQHLHVDHHRDFPTEDKGGLDSRALFGYGERAVRRGNTLGKL
jgi:hypothetical protein